jgi:hypothetical protein
MLDLIRRVSYIPHGPPEKELPEGIWELPRGKFWANCCCCEQACEIDEEIVLSMEGGEGKYWCGGSPRCCP